MKFKHWLDEGYPRPQLCREGWFSLNGPWRFVADPDNIGWNEQWYDKSRAELFSTEITVPFPPGSKLSGTFVDEPRSVPEVVWYQRVITAEELGALGAGSQLYVNFEAVDYETDIWVDGQHRVHHTGGYSPFSVLLGTDRDRDYTVVVRAFDSKEDRGQPRGKQEWGDHPMGIWYMRSNGIWRDVWIEARPPVAVDGFYWETDLDASVLRLEVSFTAPAPVGSELTVKLEREGEPLTAVTQAVSGYSTKLQFHLPVLENRLEWPMWLWSPDHPTLLDVEVTLSAGAETDNVVSYTGMRTVGTSNRYLLINKIPVYLRGILDQGYWPDSWYTDPSADSIREDVELIKSLGFNFARMHQKSPDQRYLAWADLKGLVVWAETGASFAYNERSMLAVSEEWNDLVIRDRAHPSVVAWVPFNESWGVGSIETDRRQQAFVDSVVSMTRALDPSRPISANDGWEQRDTDLVTVHDYPPTGGELARGYASVEAIQETIGNVGPLGRVSQLLKPWEDDRPVFISEFGGISMGTLPEGGFSYGQADSPEEFAQRFSDLITGVLSSPVLAGFCYTQLTDTGQEINGLCTADRTPKIPAEQIRAIVSDHGPQPSQLRPRMVSADAAPGTF